MKKINVELVEENGKVYEVTTWESRRELRGADLQKQLDNLTQRQQQLQQMKSVVDVAEEKARKDQEEKERKDKEEKNKKPE